MTSQVSASFRMPSNSVRSRGRRRRHATRMNGARPVCVCVFVFLLDAVPSHRCRNGARQPQPLAHAMPAVTPKVAVTGMTSLSCRSSREGGACPANRGTDRRPCAAFILVLGAKSLSRNLPLTRLHGRPARVLMAGPAISWFVPCVIRQWSDSTLLA